MDRKERQHFKAQFRTRSGYKIRASFDRKQDEQAQPRRSAATEGTIR